MDLWIRSQDKEELLKVERVFIRNNTICANIRETLGTTVLAEYQTKERTLEILDEIQDFYDYLIGLNLVSRKTSEEHITDLFRNNKSLAYQLPQE